MSVKLLREAVRGILIERSEIGPAVKALLQRIDDGPYHMMPVDEFTVDELRMLAVAQRAGLIKHLPASARFPERFVLSSGGSHATDTFDMNTYHDEKPLIRQARRGGYLKGMKW